MDVFSAALDSGFAFLRDAAIAAAHELGLFDARPGAADARPGAAAARTAPTRRMRALLAVLDAIGAFDGPPPPCPQVPREGWGRIAEVIRADRPLGIDPVHEHGYQQHLLGASAPAARELVAGLPTWLGREPRTLIDLGGGAGAYTAAFLDAYPAARATLVDREEVILLAREALARFGDRVAFVAGDAQEVAADARDVAGDASRELIVSRHDIALLANVLHLHGPATCGELCAAAARAGDLVVVKDLRPDTLQGQFFALGMAIYTDAGDVYSAGEIRSWLPELVLEHRLEVAEEGFVLTAMARTPDLADPAIPAGFARVLARAITHMRASHELAGASQGIPPARGASRADRHDDVMTGSRQGRPPAGGASVADRHDDVLTESLEGRPHTGGASHAHRHNDVMTGSRQGTLDHRSHASRGAHDVPAHDVPAHDDRVQDDPAATILAHYTRAMPARLAEQLALPIFHAPLDWSRLPRLSAAIDRLEAILADAGVVDAGVADAGVPPIERAATLAALYERTYYGRLMPLLYGDAHLQRDGEPHAIIDRYLVAPLVHELCHLGPARPPIDPPHLDECIGGWLAIHVHGAFGEDDAIYGAPWLAQVGQAVARTFGIRAVVRAHAGIEPLPAWFTRAAEQLGWRDWTARRSLHLLADTMDPLPWVALARSRGVPEDRAFDRIIVRDALRAMCLVSERDGAGFRTRAEVPAGPVMIADGWMTTARRGEIDRVDPRYWVPVRGSRELHIGALAEIEAITARLCSA